MTLGLINANPIVHETRDRTSRSADDPHSGDAAVDALDVFDILFDPSTDFVRDIRDPEHPYSLEQLSVLSEESITVDEKLGRIKGPRGFSDLLRGAVGGQNEYGFPTGNQGGFSQFAGEAGSVGKNEYGGSSRDRDGIGSYNDNGLPEF
ncbi:uncharacterized protein A4U43_C07F31490 [Asparagus officinalis]|uniref:Uncharacterized protein n=1 Tax=Asparagus officinalis TaxID=4686 RepID=A0A5P1EJZ7_ASPOF|nr:uncharacterized protein A4U43_C07F31490 [Asparagus officinalis]